MNTSEFYEKFKEELRKQRIENYNLVIDTKYICSDSHGVESHVLITVNNIEIYNFHSLDYMEDLLDTIITYVKKFGLFNLQGKFNE